METITAKATEYKKYEKSKKTSGYVLYKIRGYNVYSKYKNMKCSNHLHSNIHLCLYIGFLGFEFGCEIKTNLVFEVCKGKVL